MKKHLIISIILFLSTILSTYAKDYSRQESINIITSTLYHEARSEGEIGIRAVASVIYNRSERKPWKKLGLAGVCTQRKQFSCNNKGIRIPNPKGKADEKALKICEEVAIELVDKTFNPIHTCDHYVTIQFLKKAKSNHWCKNMKNTIIIRNHIFGEL